MQDISYTVTRNSLFKNCKPIKGSHKMYLDKEMIYLLK